MIHLTKGLFPLLFFGALISSPAFAHELWVLTPDQVMEWSSKPKPETFTRFTIATVIVLISALLINVYLVQLNANGAKNLFPIIRNKLYSLRHFTPLVLRICLAWALLSSTFGMEPRVGGIPMTEPTLIAPDLPVSLLPAHWQWLLWFQCAVGVMLLSGLYTRLAAVGGCVLLCFCLFTLGSPVLAYLPSFAGVCLYLIASGGGSFYVRLPTLEIVSRYTTKLESAAHTDRAQNLMRTLAGANFLYLSIYFKLLQPNLFLAIIDVYKLPIMGLDPEIFVLIIAAVEVSIAALILANVLLRFISVVLLVAFLGFAIFLSEAETLTSHMLLYGISISFLFNGSVRWNYHASPRNALVKGLGTS